MDRQCARRLAMMGRGGMLAGLQSRIAVGESRLDGIAGKAMAGCGLDLGQVRLGERWL